MNTLTTCACYALGVALLWGILSLFGMPFHWDWLNPMWLGVILGHIAGYTNRGRDDERKTASSMTPNLPPR